AEARARREERGGLSRPDRVRGVFGGLLTVALRRPAGWLTGILVAVLVTVVVALPWVAAGAAGREPPEADDIRFAIEMGSGSSLERAAQVFDRLERAVMTLEGLDFVESAVREEGGALTVHLRPLGQRPEEVNAAGVRERVR